jgi:hypothetical protein
MIPVGNEEHCLFKMTIYFNESKCSTHHEVIIENNQINGSISYKLWGGVA